jgi:hypothetical protein
LNRRAVCIGSQARDLDLPARGRRGQINAQRPLVLRRGLAGEVAVLDKLERAAIGLQFDLVVDRVAGDIAGGSIGLAQGRNAKRQADSG